MPAERTNRVKFLTLIGILAVTVWAAMFLPSFFFQKANEGGLTNDSQGTVVFTSTGGNAIALLVTGEAIAPPETFRVSWEGAYVRLSLERPGKTLAERFLMNPNQMTLKLPGKDKAVFVLLAGFAGDFKSRFQCGNRSAIETAVALFPKGVEKDRLAEYLRGYREPDVSIRLQDFLKMPATTTAPASQ